MKISGYRSYDDGFEDVVADMMALFEIPALDVSMDMLPANIIIVSSRIVGGEQPSILSKLSYTDDNGYLMAVERMSPKSQPGEHFKSAIKRLVRLNLLALLKEVTGKNPGPWGIMRGVRPTKIVHRLLDEGLDNDEVVRRLENDYAIVSKKARLLTEIAYRQRRFLLLPEEKKRISVYVGIPYCLSRCLYCSFPSAVLPLDQNEVENFLTALEADVKSASKCIKKFGLTVDSLYVGGGTPTSLAEEDFVRMLHLVRSELVSTSTREFTVEAGRPDSTSDDKILVMREVGVTRVSVNPQSMQEKTLKLIGRNHNVRDIIVMFKKIRKIGIPVINMDIIVGLPGETVADLAQTMEQIAALAPDNLTVHTLALKRGSILKENVGFLVLSEKQIAADMMAIAESYAIKLGMVPYYLYRQKNMAGNLENIGYAIPEKECLYNIQMIEERQTIIGIGPTAATKAVVPGDYKLTSIYNPKDIRSYIGNLNNYLERREALLAKLFES
ncbi:MAG: miaB 2 [Firmicutes bacterium]|nr:miaB 2 [Bacillota bacterium]